MVQVTLEVQIRQKGFASRASFDDFLKRRGWVFSCTSMLSVLFKRFAGSAWANSLITDYLDRVRKEVKSGIPNIQISQQTTNGSQHTGATVLHCGPGHLSLQ